jgi:hypothetical protein
MLEPSGKQENVRHIDRNPLSDTQSILNIMTIKRCSVRTDKGFPTQFPAFVGFINLLSATSCRCSTMGWVGRYQVDLTIDFDDLDAANSD